MTERANDSSGASQGMRRRDFLLASGLAAGGLLTGKRVKAGEVADPEARSVRAYILSLRGRRKSRAQLRHNHFHFFASRAAADSHRTFDGDNSRISCIVLSLEIYDFLFTERGTAIADIRNLDFIEPFPLPKHPVPAPVFRRGDVNGSGAVDLSDPIGLLSHLFLGTDPPSCPDAADVDDNGSLEMTDSIRTLSWLFLGGPPPASPGPFRCDRDRTPSQRLARCHYDADTCN